MHGVFIQWQLVASCVAFKATVRSDICLPFIMTDLLNDTDLQHKPISKAPLFVVPNCCEPHLHPFQQRRCLHLPWHRPVSMLCRVGAVVMRGTSFWRFLLFLLLQMSDWGNWGSWGFFLFSRLCCSIMILAMHSYGYAGQGSALCRHIHHSMVEHNVIQKAGRRCSQQTATSAAIIVYLLPAFCKQQA